MSNPTVGAAAERAGSSSGAAAESARRWWILGVVGLAQLMVILDATIVNIALPSAQQALGCSNSDRQWVVTAYALSFGSLLLVGGRLGDMFSRKWVFITGLVGFAGACMSTWRSPRPPWSAPWPTSAAADRPEVREWTGPAPRWPAPRRSRSCSASPKPRPPGGRPR